MHRPTRRHFLHSASAAALAAPLGLSANMQNPLFAKEAASQVALGKAEHCIFLWLGGGVSQIDTWDPKRVTKDGLKDPGSAYPAIETAIQGEKICEHLSRTAPLLDRAAILRTVHHNAKDEHTAATNQMHTGRPVSGTITYPSLGSVVSHLRGSAGEGVPNYVLMAYPAPSRGPGFLGAKDGFVYLTETESGPKSLTRPQRVSDLQQARRLEMLHQMSKSYQQRHPADRQIENYLEASRQGFRLAGPEFMQAFQLDREPASLRESYGDEFGQRCLMARRLVERGVRFVEVTFNLNFVNGTGWDTHREGHHNQHLLIQSFDQAFSTLIQDLEEKQILDKTLIVMSSEFGRPASFDNAGGRGHQAQAFSVVLAGGGLRTGQVIGQTDELSRNIVSRPVSVPDLFSTIYATLGIPPEEELYDVERPVPVTDRGHPIAELLG
ncbi:Secreted protein containing DUF1501 [Planctomycetales bacterium 10988]|nr:Secreted protein containing DUF1501 [Planctomycetales bacterium 10988]